jgi:hypothetical protein
MSDVVVSAPGLPEVAYPPTVSLREVWPWALLALSLLALIYVVGVEQGASAVAPGSWVHEWVHDGRHLLSFPCH